MTCRSLRDHIKQDHGLWRRLYLQWEKSARKNYGGLLSIPNFTYSCTTRQPRVIAGQPARMWELTEVQDKPLFNAFARKAIALSHAKCCGLCGQRRRKLQPMWALNARVCSNCLRGNLISNFALHHKYGLEMCAPVQGETTLIELCANR